MASFRLDFGKADFVEFDGQLSQDGVLVIMHDSTVNRTTDGIGSVASLTVAELKALDAGSWFSPSFAGEKIPIMEEALTNIIPRAIPLIERKSGAPLDYVTVLRRLNALTNVIVQSFDWNFLAGIRALEPKIKLCALGSGSITLSTLSSINNSGARVVAWEKTDVTPAVVDLVHSQQLQLFVWTVDGPEIKAFIEMGVDGVISNDPGMVGRIQEPPTNSPASLGQDLLAYWKMDDGLTNAMATVVTDSLGGNSAVLIRTDAVSHWLASDSGALGGALQLAGTNAWINVPRIDISTNSVSVSGWIKLRELPSQLATSYGAIFDSTSDCYVLYLDKSNRELRFKITDVSGHAARPGIPEARLATNKWMHIAATYSGQVGPVSGQASIFLNGQPQDVHTGNDTTTPFGLTGAIKSGQLAAMGREGPSGGNSFFGQVDEVAFWRRALTPAEIAAIYEGGISGLTLGDLLRRPTPSLFPVASQLVDGGAGIQLDFQSQGPWTSFRLLRTLNFSRPFQALPGLEPTPIGANKFRFVCPLTNGNQQFFRIEGQ